ncbi:MAG TPA: transposase [Spirochaetota bacterium]|nr:transposase [Spirochaetota bacterium]
MSNKKRRHFSPEEKFNIVKQVVGKAKTVTEISEEYGIHPNLYYYRILSMFKAAW